MARIARVVVPGVPHHVTQRGNRRGDVFFSDANRRRYLDLLRDYSARSGVELIAYCLMTNHLHLVAVPAEESSLARLLKPVDMRYTQHVNRAQGWSGRLWQDRFYSCPMDRPHCLLAVRYLEQNPVRAGLARQAEDYPWSSARGHTGRAVDPLLSDRTGLLEPVGNWSEWLRQENDSLETDLLCLHTRTGRPLGEKEFERRIETATTRRLRARPRGRPRKSTPEDQVHED